MKISKHSHSCLLIEDKEKVILIDPGKHTLDEKALDINKLDKLDYILITHIHPDHLFIPLLKDVLQKFPQTQIISNNGVKEILRKENITVFTEGNEYVNLEENAHERAFDLGEPPNTVFTLFNRLLHPGDCLSFSSVEIIAFPIYMAWGNLTIAVEKIVTLRPRVIIPIHDYPLREWNRLRIYERLDEYFTKHNISFKKIENKETINL